MPTKIEWTDEVWNPITGCTKVSAGCKNCYAESIARRFWGDRKFSDVRFHPDRLEQPLRWRKPRRIFVCSMGDLFHEDIETDRIVGDIFCIMSLCSQHIFIILTKRINRAMEVFEYLKKHGLLLNNIWLGVSVENQQTADERIPILLRIPAAVRFVSLEPLIGPVDIENYIYSNVISCDKKGTVDAELDWVIAGCESGPHRRDCNIEWIRNIKNQCVEAGVPVFIKQASVDGKVVKMPEIDGKIWRDFPKNIGK